MGEDTQAWAGDEQRSVRDRLKHSHSYEKTDFYKTSGFCQAIARGGCFTGLSTAVTCLFLVWMSIDTDFNAASKLFEAAPIFIVMQFLFLTFFAGEWLVRMMAFHNWRHAFNDGRVRFDGVMLALFVCGLLGGPLLLVHLQLLRGFNLCAAIPELEIVCKGLFVACRSVMFMCLLLVLVLYIFAIVLTGMRVDLFPNVSESMWSLVTRVLLPDQGDVLMKLKDQNLAAAVVCLIFIPIGVGLLWMSLAVCCNIVNTVAEKEKDGLIEKYMQPSLESAYRELFGERQNITKVDYFKLLEHHVVGSIMRALNVDMPGLVDASDAIFGCNPDAVFALRDFPDLAMKFGHGRKATCQDVMLAQNGSTKELKELKTRMVGMERMIEQLLSQTQTQQKL